MIPDEREWQAQERALRIERGSDEPHDLEPLTAAYLPIARALRTPIEMKLDNDFASRVADLAEARRINLAVESRFEQTLLVALGGIFGVSAVIVCLLYGGTWIGPILDRIGPIAKPEFKWMLALAACVTVSWLSDRFRDQPRGPHRTTA